jgi:hypothetical protein
VDNLDLKVGLVFQALVVQVSIDSSSGGEGVNCQAPSLKLRMVKVEEHYQCDGKIFDHFQKKKVVPTFAYYDRFLIISRAKLDCDFYSIVF